jgi:hypothetical protein
VERVEKSSETGSDFVSTSAFNKPISVTGTPSICVTTQMQSNRMRDATPLVRHEERNVPGRFWIIKESTINKNALSGLGTQRGIDSKLGVRCMVLR